MPKTSLALLLLAATTAHAQEWPPGADIDPALHVDITDDGFAQLGGVVDQVLPPSIDIPRIDQSGSADILGFSLASYEFNVWNGKVNLGIPQLDLVPDYDVIHLDATLNLRLNSSQDPMYMRAFAEALWITVLNTTCDVYVTDVPIPLSADIGLQVVDVDTDGDGVADTSELDASITNLSVNIDALDGGDINITNCGIGDFIEFLEDIGIDLVSLLRPVLQGVIDDQASSLTGELETTIEDLFNQLVIEQSIDLLGSTLDLKLAPSDVVIVPDGARVSMFGSAYADEHPCVAQYGYEGSLATPGGAEAIGMAAPGVAQPHHVGLFLDDDFGNQALFSVWRAGALCFTVSEDSGLDLPIPLNSSLLGLINGEIYDPLFPENTPLIIETRPRVPPTLATSEVDDLVIDVEGLGLDFYAGLDGRMARIVGAELATDVPLNLDFNGTTGELLIDVGLTADNIDTSVVFNELAPGRDDEIADSFGGLLGTVVDTVAGGLLEGLAFGLPSLDGFGLQSLEFAPSGPAGDWVGGYAAIGDVPYAGGCDENGGCDSGGCSGGCGVNGPSPSRALLFALPLVIGLRRRRQD
ncbi:MAG: hypothetical protein EP330_00465 [Deltaproteobacteria bacterium]|nr:MAG: hypothetical protein EP330_00465 [Deltaproteobacteria bacterium]